MPASEHDGKWSSSFGDVYVGASIVNSVWHVVTAGEECLCSDSAKSLYYGLGVNSIVVSVDVRDVYWPSTSIDGIGHSYLDDLVTVCASSVVWCLLAPHVNYVLGGLVWRVVCVVEVDVIPISVWDDCLGTIAAARGGYYGYLVI